MRYNFIKYSIYTLNKGDKHMTLRECKVNENYIVKNMDLEQATMVRIKALGLTDGTQIRILNNKRSGAVIFHVRGTRLAVGKDIAEAIRVTPVSKFTTKEEMKECNQ